MLHRGEGGRRVQNGRNRRYVTFGQAPYQVVKSNDFSNDIAVQVQQEDLRSFSEQPKTYHHVDRSFVMHSS